MDLLSKSQMADNQYLTEQMLDKPESFELLQLTVLTLYWEFQPENIQLAQNMDQNFVLMILHYGKSHQQLDVSNM
jgi:hypothetical protein